MTGAGCPKWNGGRTTTGKDGRYTLVRAPAGYPFPQSVSARGYIREHRLVMELHLGRALQRTEVVHHRNHDTHDNRLENLELIESQSVHMKGHSADGMMFARWPKCVGGCGRQAKPHQGRRFLACGPCRLVARNRHNPTMQASEPWPRPK